MDNVLAIILAGGRGERLSALAQERSKPAIPFAGKYRIIDFTLSNCVNSGIHNIAVLTQYQPSSLIDHIGIGAPWELDRSGRVLRVIQAHLAGKGRGWYKGTTDAVYQNFQYIEEQKAEMVLILSGDPVCKMDYSWMLKFHEERQADVTLAFTRCPEEELHQFGTITTDTEERVIGFQEKVKQPKSNMVSMGVYLFKNDILQRCLEEDAKRRFSRHDFGRDVLPRMVAEGKHRVFAYDFQGYWRDVGTVQMYWQSNMDMIEMSPGGFLSDAGWPIRTKEEERAPAMVSGTAEVVNSFVSSGCVVEGRVEHSVISPGVKVAEGAVVKDSIILSDSIVGPHSVIDYSILDKEVVVKADCHIGFGDDFQVNRKEPKLLNTGLTIVGKRAELPSGVRIGRNCVICCGVMEDDFLTSEVQSGETIKTRQGGYPREHSSR